MSIVKFNALTEGRQSTIRYIIEIKAKIKALEASIETMVKDTKTYLQESKYNEVINEDGTKVCYLKDRPQPPTYKQVMEKVQDQLDDKTKAILQKAYEAGVKEVQSLMFN